MAYMDNTGLYRKYGTEKTTANIAGEYRTNTSLREIELKIDLTNLSQTETIQSDQTFMPSGARIQEIEIVTHTAAATGTAIDLGLIQADRSTEIDYDGLLAAFPIASMNAAGEKTIITDNTTYDGALVGTTTANVGYITCSQTDATDFTAGVIYVKIRFYMP